MSVEKCTFSKDEISYPFTQIPNHIINEIKNMAALGLWSYLQSKPSSWEFHKDKIQDETGLGRDKLDTLLKILEQHNLAAISQNRDEKGKFSGWHLHVKNGANFNPCPEKPAADNPFPEKPLTENQLLENRSYKDIYINKYKNINKYKSFYRKDQKKSNEQKHSFAENKNAMANEKKHTQQNEMWKKDILPKNLKQLSNIGSNNKSEQLSAKPWNIPWGKDTKDGSHYMDDQEKRSRNFKLYIDKGTETCKKLKKLYPELDWFEIANKFTIVRQKARKFYGLDDLELLQKLMVIPLDELKDIVEIL